jgi:formylglycine-generating enzyme required for sulfatase activity
MNTFVKNNSLLTNFKSIIYPIGSNTVNWYKTANWNGTTTLTVPGGNVTTVGTNGGSSAYGTYDQSGLVEEYLENYQSTISGIIYMYRHAASFDDTVNYLRYTDLFNINIVAAGVVRGFRVASLNNPHGYNNFIPVWDANNVAAPNGYGSVPYLFNVAKYNVTNNEYKDFLIAIASIDNAPSVPSNVYLNDMATNISGGITRTLIGGSGSSSQYVYTVKANMGNKPINFVSWKMAARYINWLHNGKPSGSQNAGTTEDGAYDINLSIPIRKVGAKYFLPNINEWTKAGFYKGGSTNAGYWLYATQSNTVPNNITATATGDGILV